MPYQSFSFICLKFEKLQPYKVAEAERLIYAENEFQVLIKTVVTYKYVLYRLEIHAIFLFAMKLEIDCWVYSQLC